jgi:hypothetical protein
MNPMNRREAMGLGARAAMATALWAALPARTWAALPVSTAWSAEEEQRLNLIGDTLIPATAGSPGAGAVGIGRFILAMTVECHPPEAMELVRRALRDVEAESRSRYSRSFAELSGAEREATLVAYEKQPAGGAKGNAVHPFRHLKELTLIGYFTSEAGATQALRYDPVPGTYRGSVPLKEGDRSWTL